MDFGFDLLIGRSLKHVKTGKCIHTSGAWPGVNRNMVLWSGCNEQRLELWFRKQGKSILFSRELSNNVLESVVVLCRIACNFPFEL